MQRLLLILLAFHFAFPCAGVAASALTWETRRLDLRPAPGEKEVRGEFKFTNTSRETVTIDSVRPSCGCTTAKLDKKAYAAGETGVVNAVFTIGGRRGLQAKGIEVKVRGESEGAMLILMVYIPESVTMEPKIVYWNIGEKADSKTIKLTLSAGSTMRPKEVTSTNTNITASLETVREGREYRLVVKPVSTGKPLLSILSVDCTPAKTGEVIQAYAKIAPARAPTPKP